MRQKEEIEKTAALFAEFEGRYGVIFYKSYDEAKRGHALQLNAPFDNGVSSNVMLSLLLIRRSEIAKEGSESMQDDLAFIDMLLARFRDDGIRVVPIAAHLDAPKGVGAVVDIEYDADTKTAYTTIHKAKKESDEGDDEEDEQA